jgi:hypothetical protein
MHSKNIDNENLENSSILYQQRNFIIQFEYSKGKINIV